VAGHPVTRRVKGVARSSVRSVGGLLPIVEQYFKSGSGKAFAKKRFLQKNE
jgi:hypothetical protein